MKNIQYQRKCSNCQKELTYFSYDTWHRANKNNTLCLSCAKSGKSNGRLGKKHTLETKLKISISSKNKSPVSDETKYKMSVARRKRKITLVTKNKLSQSLKGRIISPIHKLNLSISNTGKLRSEDTKYKIRLATIRDLQKKGITGSVKNYNPKACKFINELNKKYGYKFQHAENGGEVELYGYFVDGYDKEKNIIFEYDESHHNNLSRKQKDIQRQNKLINIIHPHMFLRYDEENDRLYNVME